MACSWRVFCRLIYGRTSHVWLFEGAEGGKWVDEIENQFHDSRTSSPLSDFDAEPAEDNKRQMKKIRTQ